jgi:hypothetical protein
MFRLSTSTGACRARLAVAPGIPLPGPGRTSIALAMLGALSASAFAANQISIHIEGDIVSECAISGVAAGATLDLGDLAKAGSKDFPFTLNCNAPFNYRLEAQYGALTNALAGGAPAGFTATLPYDVAMHIPTNGAPIDDRCSSDSLQTGRVTCTFTGSGNNIAIGSEARLAVTWSLPGKAAVAGDYVDRLTISVATSL